MTVSQPGSSTVLEKVKETKKYPEARVIVLDDDINTFEQRADEANDRALDRQQDKFFGAWLEAVGSNWDTPAGRDIVWRSRSSKTPDLLVKILLNKKTTEEEKPRYIRALDFQSGPEKDAALIKLRGAGS